MKKIRFALTGATGLVGVNLLWEIIKNNIDQLENIQIFILGRSIKDKSLFHRLEEKLKEDGIYYISLERSQQEKVVKLFNVFCHCIELDFVESNGRVSNADKWALSSAPIDYFYHIGASTDLRGGKIIESVLLRTNIQGTQNILNLVNQLKIGIFSYVGTAYSCGEGGGDIDPDYVNVYQNFRNPYERTKLFSEIIVREFAKESNINIKIFRPSVIGGRLSELPIGSTNKFDVFYGWAAFFLALKKKEIKENNKLYVDPINLDIRICFSQNSGLNIVPVDYVVKSMYLITTKEIKGNSFHLVSKNELFHKDYIPAMLNFLNVHGVKYVDSIPENKTQNETLYYRTAGKVLTPYITSNPINFKVDNYEKEIRMFGIDVPCMTIDKFISLLEYAKKYDFGIA